MLSPMRLEEVLQAIRPLAPEHLAESWDKVGLQLGHGDWPVRRALLCIDLTEAVLAEAIETEAQLIVAYHPPIFSPLVRLTGDDWKGRIVLACAKREIAIYSPHTALDAAEDGLNDWLARGLGAGQVSPIAATAATAGPEQVKFVTFVPPEHADRIRHALAAAGAGWIGNYSHCTFNIPGTGTFRGEEGANPTVGEAGRLETVQEIRIETICPVEQVERVVAALREAHPYEEPAFDIYRLLATPAATPARTGQGRRIVLDEPVDLDTLIARVKRLLGVTALAVGRPAKPRPIRTVAVCAGAGGSVLAQATDADAWFTGEMRHHDVLAAVQDGRAVLLPGHTQTERPYLPTYRDRLARATGGEVEWRVSEADRAAAAVE